MLVPITWHELPEELQDHIVEQVGRGVVGADVQWSEYDRTDVLQIDYEGRTFHCVFYEEVRR